MNMRFIILLFFLLTKILLVAQTKYSNFLPGVFIQNIGQAIDQNGLDRNDIFFYGSIGEYSFYFKKGGISYQLYERIKDNISNDLELTSTIVHRTDIQFLNINELIFPVGKSQSLESYNYYFAQEKGVTTGVKTYQEILYNEIYNGIDLKYYVRKGSIEYDFIVHPFSNPDIISWNVKGASRISINERGKLIIETPLGRIEEEAPVAYQGDRLISSEWVLNGEIVSFKLGEYDLSQTLVIDPIVRVWGTFYGGTNDDRVHHTEVDNLGNVIVAGRTGSSTNIATSGAHIDTLTSFNDTYIAKFDSNGVRQWATYYLSSELNDLVVDDSLNIYVVGSTTANIGVATSGAHQTTLNNKDAYLSKFNTNGVRIWSTYYGGSSSVLFGEIGNSCAVDNDFNVFLTGTTQSVDSIATVNSYQDSLYSSSNTDAFLVKFDGNGVRQWGTYFGGNDDDESVEIAISDSGDVYMVGRTMSTMAIATIGSHQTTNSGNWDAFLVKFSGSGTRQWATYYGGIIDEWPTSIDVDIDGNIVTAGFTGSNSGIATNGVHQSSHGGGSYDSYIAKFSSSGARIWATYYGGSADDFIEDISCRNSDIFIAGRSASYNNIATWNGYQSTKSSSVTSMFSKFNGSGILIWGSYFKSQTRGMSISQDNDRNVYLGGYCSNANGVSTIGSHQSLYGGGSFDGMLEKFRDCRFDSVNVNITSCFRYTSPSGKNTWTESGTYKDTVLNNQGCDSILIINLTIDTVDKRVSQNQNTLNAVIDSLVYQWIDCDGYLPIPGSVGRYYTAQTNGSYAVIITQGNCSDTSLCYSVNGIGIKEGQGLSELVAFPNPTEGDLFIDLGKEYDIINFEITNSIGQVINEGEFNSSSDFKLNIDGPSGLYMIKIILDNKIEKSIHVILEK